MEELKKLASELEKSESEIDENREIWVEKTLPLIKKTLKNLKDNILKKAYVEVNDRIKNLESVYLSFVIQKSGLIEQVEKIKVLVKKSGAIFYSLDYCGRVIVWYSLPTIEGVIETNDKFNKIRYVELSEINEKTIIKDVKLFIKKIIEWNNGIAYENRRPIGFLTSKP